MVMLHKNTKVKVRSQDGDSDYLDIVINVLQGDTLTPYLFIRVIDYVLGTYIDLMKENGFKLAKERSRIYPAQTITDEYYADGIPLLANSPAQAESLKHRLEWAANGVSLHVNSDKTEYMYFNKKKKRRHLNTKG